MTAVSLVAHLWLLGMRPLAHDEAIDAWFSWQAGGGDLVKYDPVYHGPLRFYLEGGILHAFGDSPFWARFLAAMCGVAMTAIIALSVRLLGRVGAPVAALVFTFSPTVLTITRTGREDSMVALLSLGLLLLIVHIIEQPRTWHFLLTGALLAAMWATKETVFLFGFAAAWFFAAALVIAWRRPEGNARQAVRRISGLGDGPWWLAAAGFLGVFTLVFSGFFRHADGIRAGFVDGIRYWWSQHPVNRGSQQWHFYLTIYTAYEWLLLPLAVAGAIAVVRRRSVWGAWLITMWLGQTALYSWAGERFAWLALHPLVPATLLAGVGAEAIWRRATARTQRTRHTVSLAFGALLALSAVVAWRPAVTDGADPRELLVTVQTTDDVPPISHLLHRAVRDETVSSILIDTRDGGSWPWAWYLHDLPVAYVEVGESLPEGYDAMIVWDDGTPPVAPEGYEVHRFRLRGWWLPDYGDASPLDLVKWFFTRDTWNDTGYSWQYLVIKEAALN